MIGHARWIAELHAFSNNLACTDAARFVPEISAHIIHTDVLVRTMGGLHCERDTVVFLYWTPP